MKVLKFGGSSLNSITSLSLIKQIVEAEKTPVVVVVSALEGVTDKLIEMAEKASQQLPYESLFEAIYDKHFTLVEALFEEDPKTQLEDTPKIHLKERLKQRLEEIQQILRGIFLIGDLPTKTLNTLISYGERLSALIITALIPQSKYQCALPLIKTEKKQGKDFVHLSQTTQNILTLLSPINQTIIIPGFIASDLETNEITTLGRGGSDYTAALIASALKATQLEIWTDVDGFLTADPKAVPTAYPIPHLSYKEAMELCNFGANLLYPPTIYPVYKNNIPIYIKNTFNRQAPGTLIDNAPQRLKNTKIKGVSSIPNTCLLTIQGLGMVGVIGVNTRIFKALSSQDISVFFVSQTASENNTSIGVHRNDVKKAETILTQEFEKEILCGAINPIQVQQNLCTIAIVGEGMQNCTGIAGKLFGTLGRNGINVIASAQGAMQTNISFIIHESLLSKGLKLIHDAFFLSPYQVLNVYICGVGTVGKSLLQQIHQQKETLKAKKGLQINVVGIANSKKAIYDEEGLSLSTYAQQLQEQSLFSTAEDFKNKILSQNFFNSVFVDCTASKEVASLYEELLKHNVHVVAANKIACSSAYPNYAKLKEIAEEKDVKFLYEANVGAGLPIIQTIDNMVNSGDKIIQIEAVLSGTLNYIFNTLSPTIPFSKALQKAQEEGYAEPDPRIDLSGEDVVRKLVILIREAGYQIEQNEVEKQLFLPDHLFQGNVEDFWQALPHLDAHFEQQRAEMIQKQARLRFIAQYNKGKASVQLVAVPQTHPFYELADSNNIILLTTERYNKYPLLIQGYGAGADVTAAGVFADLISIANIR